MRVIILTSDEGDRSVLEAVRSGAHAYLPKSVEPSAMLRTLRQGEASTSSTVAARLLQGLDRGSPPRGPAPACGSGLSPREQEALRLIAARNGAGAIAEALGITEGVVANILQNILQKLYVEGRVEAALRGSERARQASARENGAYLGPPQAPRILACSTGWAGRSGGVHWPGRTPTRRSSRWSGRRRDGPPSSSS